MEKKLENTHQKKRVESLSSSERGVKSKKKESK